MKGRTVIAIAHRLSTIENADWVVVLDKGLVVEQGVYSDLLKLKGKLWEFHALQYQLNREGQNGFPLETSYEIGNGGVGRQEK